MHIFLGLIRCCVLIALEFYFPSIAYAQLSGDDAKIFAQPKAPAMDIERMRDPFQSHLLLNNASPSTKAASPHPERPRQALEFFDLAALRLVGIFQKGHERIAMVEDITGKGHMVRIGQYMGKQQAKVVRITHDTVHLVQHTINPAGERIRHNLSLSLKEVNTP